MSTTELFCNIIIYDHLSTYLNRKPRNQIASFLSGMTRKDGRLQIRFYAVVTFPKRKCCNFFKLRVEF